MTHQSNSGRGTPRRNTSNYSTDSNSSTGSRTGCLKKSGTSASARKRELLRDTDADLEDDEPRRGRGGGVRWPSSKEKLERIRRKSSLSEEQVKSLWLNYQDFLNIRERNKSAIYSDRGYSKLLPGKNGEEDQEDHLRQIKLDLWAKVENDLNMRGLERNVSDDHRQWRRLQTQQVRVAVLEAQAVAQEDEELEDFSQFLAEISLEYSKQSTEFAVMLGKADEKAAQQIQKQRSIKTNVPQHNSSGDAGWIKKV